MRIFMLALLGLELFAPIVQARPVSYPGGWTLMLMNNGERHFAHIHYSPTVNISVGYKFEDWRDQGFTLNAFQLNNLVKRWNEEDSQANFYLKSAVGIAKADNDNDAELAGFTGISLDWEDRRYFISYENRYTEAQDIADFYQQSARVGWAPYKGDYGDLHTWIMLQVEHMPEAEDSFKVTPLVRLFKDTHLLETGFSDNGDFMLNYIFRY